MSNESERELKERVQRAYRRAGSETGAARARLLERLHSEPPPRRAWNPGWWLNREGFALSPATVAAWAAGLLVAGVLLGRAMEFQSPRPMRPATASLASRDSGIGASEQARRVTFALSVPGAARVSVAGDFNAWDPNATPLRRAALGNLWTVEVPLAQGLHVYAFVVDGERWIPDPSALLAPPSEFGTRSSVVVVGNSGAL